jgi:hypothetical protein
VIEERSSGNNENALQKISEIEAVRVCNLEDEREDRSNGNREYVIQKLNERRLKW